MLKQRFFSDINRIGSNIWIVLPVSSETSDFTPCEHALFYISNTLRKLIINAKGLVFR